MGYPMAGYLARAGHEVTVFNRTRARADKWLSEHNGTLAETVNEAAKDAEILFTCVGNDDDVREVHRHYHVPASNTAVGRIILENA